MLHGLIARLDCRDVHLVGHVSNEELTAYYGVGDIFVSASEHEGFCVPLVESFYMGVPVLAYAATAVPSTMDGAGILYTEKDPMHLAALINAVTEDPDLVDRIVDGRYAALARLEAKDFAGTCSGIGRRARIAAQATAGHRLRFLGSSPAGGGV